MKWISVKDKLPDKEGCYLVNVECIDGNVVTVSYYSEEHKLLGMPHISHWMPLPEPPE